MTSPRTGLARRLTLALLAASTLATSGCCILGPFGGGLCFPGGPGGGGGGGRDGGGHGGGGREGGPGGGRGDDWRLSQPLNIQPDRGQR
jgi:hypothetical protein